MSSTERPNAVTAAANFVQRHFPTCSVALLAGSTAHGEAHARSDLDLVVISDGEHANWETFEEFGWLIEVFVRTPDSYQTALTNETQGRWPLLTTLCYEGIVLYDRDGLATTIKAEAQRVLEQGPAPLTAEEVAWHQYNLTWMLDDFADADDSTESYLMAHDLATTVAEFLLNYHHQWLGKGKWLIRNLRHADAARADALTKALTAFYQQQDKAPLLDFAEATLNLAGGRQFAGRSANW